MQQPADNLYTFQIPLPGSPLRYINCCLLRGGERSLLIDTAFNHDKCEQAMLAALSEIGVRMEETDIFLTHLHVDHVGLIARLKREGNAIYASAEDKRQIDDFQNPAYWDWINRSNYIAGVPEERAMDPRQHVAYLQRASEKVEIETVEEGRRFCVGGFRLAVVGLPGHTPGQIGLWDEERGFLFSGDHILEKISPNITAWNLENDYLGCYFESLRKVAAMPVRRLFPAHGSPPPDINARIEEMLRHHGDRLSLILELLRERGPANSYSIAQRIPWSTGKVLQQLPIQQQWFACAETLAHLQHLYFLGEATFDLVGKEERVYRLR